jgi:hypothetical protein
MPGEKLEKAKIYSRAVAPVGLLSKEQSFVELKAQDVS